MHAPPPLALYIHFPWCLRKCPYCDFNSHAVTGPLPEQRYLAALLADLEQELPAVAGRPVTSIFIGGGTPSLLSGDGVVWLLAALRNRLPLPPDIEITLEANPGTVDRTRFTDYRAAGINRLSLGVQSFNDQLLSRIGRIHTGSEAQVAVEAAQAAGFTNLNLDLMFGLPDQSPREAAADLTQALALEPTHLSRYQLTLEPHTPFHHRPPPLPDEEALWRMQEAGEAQLVASGYAHYEVSAFARAGGRCRHNLNYWRFGDYLGIGPGAHGKVTDPAANRITRNWKVRSPDAYLAAAATPRRLAGTRTLSPEDAAFEFMLNALRLTEGFETSLFTDRTGLPLGTVTAPLERARARGLIEWDRHSIRPTAAGCNFLNELLQLFIPEENGI